MADKPKASFAQGEYKEAVEFFRQKTNIPIETYKDLKGAYHSRAFAVAGAMRDDILSDFRQAVDKAIASGATLQEFRKSYNRIADKWAADDAGFAEKRTRKGYDAWRSKVIFSTNMATAYAAGREAQMHDPDMKDIWTYARYRCMMDGREREEHRQWNDTVLPMNDPWWSTHTPPNGWNCRCWKEPVSKAELDILEKEGVKVKEWRPTGIDNTRGIDDGWNHNVGEANFGNIYKLNGEKLKWTKENQEGLWHKKDNDKNEDFQLKTIKDKLLYPLEKQLDSKEKFKTELDKALGIKGFGQYQLPMGKNLLTYAVNTESLAEHLKDKLDRSIYTPMIAHTIKEPQEVRAVFMQSNTGKVAIRLIFYSKFAKNEKGEEKLIKVIFDANQAKFVSHTTFPKNKDKPEGKLIYRKD